MVFSLDVLQFWSISWWIKSIQLTQSALDCSVVVSGVDLDLGLVELFVQKPQSLNVLFVKSFSQVLMLSHSNRSKLAPYIVSRIAVIKGIQMIPSSVPKKTNNLVKFGRAKSNQNNKQKSFYHVRMLSYLGR